MRPITVSLSANGNSQWVRLNSQQVPFGVGLAVIPSSGASLTAKVQHTFDNPGTPGRVVQIARVTTTATVTDVNHNLSVGDSVFIMMTQEPNLDGFQTVASVIDANNYTYTVANTGAASGGNFAMAKNFKVFDHATLTGLTARADGNYAFTTQMCRLQVSNYVSGRCELKVDQGMGH